MIYRCDRCSHTVETGEVPRDTNWTWQHQGMLQPAVPAPTPITTKMPEALLKNNYSVIAVYDGARTIYYHLCETCGKDLLSFLAAGRLDKMGAKV